MHNYSENICLKVSTDIEMNSDDDKIVSGSWEHKDDIYAKFGTDDWGSMDKEVEEAMLENDDSEDEDFELNFTKHENPDYEEWDDLDTLINIGLQNEQRRSTTPLIHADNK